MHAESTRKGQLLAVTDGSLTESDARAMLERIRWPNGVVCPLDKCGGSEPYRIEVKSARRKSGAAVGPRHLFKCKVCKRQFSVTKGTIFEDSKIPLRTWIMVMYRMCSSKKGYAAYQIHREFGMSYKNAWFMAHRIRFAMQDKKPTKLKGVIEADETYVGGKLRGHKAWRKKAGITAGDAQKAGRDKKAMVFGILERGGKVRAMPIKGEFTQAYALDTLMSNIDVENSALITDEHRFYHRMRKTLPHGVIKHASEYVRGDVHTQGIEGFWAILKRGLIGTYHQVDEGYLGQYVNEFAFRHNTRKISDAERFTALMGNVSGRLDWYLSEPSTESAS
ncbi:MAG TPA: IS1595 family transposase [Dehalococcoidia bacterium]|nr:IS1595 family transposase [Dehalococcoidia bacterium]